MGCCSRCITKKNLCSRAHSDRVISLARRLGVEANCADKMNVGKYCEIDYAKVNEELNAFRAQSIEVLKEMLQA